MRIINVIELQGGVLDNIESFVIHQPEEDTITPQIVIAAEEMFAKKAREHGCEDVEVAIESGSFIDSYKGYEILLIWSTVNE